MTFLTFFVYVKPILGVLPFKVTANTPRWLGGLLSYNDPSHPRQPNELQSKRTEGQGSNWACECQRSCCYICLRTHVNMFSETVETDDISHVWLHHGVDVEEHSQQLKNHKCNIFLKSTDLDIRMD